MQPHTQLAFRRRLWPGARLPHRATTESRPPRARSETLPSPTPSATHDRAANLVALVAVTALAPIAWGSTYLVTTEMLPPDRPLLAATMRALPVGVLLVAAFGRRPHGIWWMRTAVLGALNIGLFFALLFVAAYRLPGGVAATMGAIQPLVVAGLATAVLGERLSGVKLAAGVGGVAGVALLVLRSQAALDPLGILAALGGAVVMASGVVLTKRWGRPAPLHVFTAWQLTAGGLVLAPIAFVLEGPPPSLGIENVTGFAYLGIVGTAAAYMLWFRGIERLGASAASFLALLSPLVATLLGIAVLGQTLTPLQALGVLLVLASVAAGQMRSRGRRRLDVPGGQAGDAHRSTPAGATGASVRRGGVGRAGQRARRPTSPKASAPGAVAGRRRRASSTKTGTA